MMLIGKTANWLLCHSIQRCVKSRNEFVHMREITQSVKVAPKCLIAVVLVDVNLPYWTSEVEHLVTFAAIVSNILPCMHRNGCLGTFGKIYDTIFGSSTPISLESAKFWRFGDVFHWFLDFISWKFAIFLLLVYFTYCAKFDVDMTIHFWLIAFLLLMRCVTVTLTFDLLTLTSSHTWRVTWSTLRKS